MLDKGTFSGLLVAAGGILLGLLLEGGNIGQVLQPTAAMIVFGGTIGAVLVQFPFAIVLRALRSLKTVFSESPDDPAKAVEQLVGFAVQARREGIVSLDGSLDSISDPFLKRSLMLAIDGTEAKELKKIIELELENRADQEDRVPAVFEAAGGYSPTVGIIGAVLGLIQVMQHLENIDEVGRGIAVAFVATIYGVAASNLLFLPAAGKLKMRLRQQHIVREMMLEGVVSITEGINPRLLETKLFSFLEQKPDSRSNAQEAERAVAAGESA